MRCALRSCARLATIVSIVVAWAASSARGQTFLARIALEDSAGGCTSGVTFTLQGQLGSDPPETLYSKEMVDPDDVGVWTDVAVALPRRLDYILFIVDPGNAVWCDHFFIEQPRVEMDGVVRFDYLEHLYESELWAEWRGKVMKTYEHDPDSNNLALENEMAVLLAPHEQAKAGAKVAGKNTENGIYVHPPETVPGAAIIRWRAPQILLAVEPTADLAAAWAALKLR